MFLFLCLATILEFILAIDLWHSQEKKRLLIRFKTFLKKDSLSFALVEVVGLHGLYSEEAKKIMFSEKIPGFYDYE